MARILTGIQSTGTPHLGNILGAIIPAIELSKKNNESFLFIADLHSLTQIKDAEVGTVLQVGDGIARVYAFLIAEFGFFGVVV